METVRLVGFGIAAALLALTLRQSRPEMAALVAMAAGICIFMEAAEQMGALAEMFRRLSEAAEMENGSLRLLLKITGISILCESGAQLCRDAGENGIAAKVEMGGRIAVLALSAPLALALCEMVLSFVRLR